MSATEEHSREQNTFEKSIQVTPGSVSRRMFATGNNRDEKLLKQSSGMDGVCDGRTSRRVSATQNILEISIQVDPGNLQENV